MLLEGGLGVTGCVQVLYRWIPKAHCSVFEEVLWLGRVRVCSRAG